MRYVFAEVKVVRKIKLKDKRREEEREWSAMAGKFLYLRTASRLRGWDLDKENAKFGPPRKVVVLVVVGVFLSFLSTGSCFTIVLFFSFTQRFLVTICKP